MSIVTGTRKTEDAARAAGAPVRVTMIGTLPPVKGISPYTAQLLAGLAAQPDAAVEFIGFKSIYPRWLYPGGEPAERAAAAPELPGVDVRNILTWYNPISWLRAGLGLKGDVVHAQWWSYALAHVYVVVLGLARLRGKRIVLTVHNVAPHENGRIKALLNRAVFRLADAFVVHSEENRAALASMVKNGASVRVLPHGILETPRTGLDMTEARELLGLPSGPGRNVILCFGNVRPYKGVDVLLRAFADVLRAEPDTTLVIAGKPWESWDRYGALIQELGLADHVKLALDFVPTDEVERYFMAADVVVLPYTHFDAQSGVGSLALPFGRPLVVSGVGGLGDLVVHDAARVPPGDPSALARALTSVLRDAALREQLAADSLMRAAQLDWGPIAAATVETYRAVTAPAGVVPEFLPRETAAEDAAAPANGAVPSFLRRKLRVGIVTFDFWPAIGGQGRYTYELWRRLLENDDIELHVFSPAPNDLPGHHRVFPWTRRSGGHVVFSAMTSLAIERWRRRYGIDVFHLNGGPGGVSLLRTPHAPVIYTAHHTYSQQERYMRFPRWKRVLKSLEERAYRAADAIVAVSPSTGEELSCAAAAGDRRLLVIPNGVDASVFRNLTLDRDPGSILYVGRLDERKGIDFLLRAMPEIVRRMPGAKLTIVGSGPLAGWLRSFIRDLGLEEVVRLTNGISDEELVELYSRSMVAVVPSVFEGFGLAAAEALACGAPVVATDRPGLRDVVENGKNGLLVPFGDTDALAEAVGRVLNDGALREQLSSVAAGSVTSRFDWDRVAEHWRSIYQAAASGQLDTVISMPRDPVGALALGPSSGDATSEA